MVARDHFCSVCSFLSTQSESAIRTANWLLISLHHLLYPHLKTDRHLSRKQGTILLRNGGDPLAVLHATLAWCRSKCLRLDGELEESKRHESHMENVNVSDKLPVCLDMNSRLQAATTKLSQFDLSNIHTIQQNEVVNYVDAVLCNVIVLLTLTSTERKTLLSDQVNWTRETHLRVSDLLHHGDDTRLLKRVFLLSVMLDCVNSHCSLLLHLVLADVVDSWRRSAELLSILNRIGATSSRDTLERFQVAQAVSRNFLLMTDLINLSSFCTASIDNIDKNCPFGAVYTEQSSRGFHGICVQALENKKASCQSNSGSLTFAFAASKKPRCRNAFHFKLWKSKV